MPYSEENRRTEIYMLTCKISGKRYIGQSIDIRRRWAEHKKCRSWAPVISKAIAKYGWENFEKEILEECTKEELNEREIYYIAKYSPEYNLTQGGDGNIGYKPPPEVREKLSKAAQKQWQSPEQKALFKKPIICIETGEIFESVNNAAPKVGVTHSCISMALNGGCKTAGGYRWVYLNPEDKFSEETRKNLGKSNRGRKQSADQIEKRAAKLRGKKNEHYNSYKKVVCVETGEIFESVKIAAEKIGVVPSFVSKVLHGKKKTAGGYHWKFVKEQEND